MTSLFSKTISLRKELKISDAEFSQLRDFIYAQSGIYVADNRKYLVENRLATRIKELNLKSFAEYHAFLQYDAGRRQELNRLFEVITTNETSFYRNPPQLEVFQKNVLPEILDQCRQKGQELRRGRPPARRTQGRRRRARRRPRRHHLAPRLIMRPVRRWRSR